MIRRAALLAVVIAAATMASARDVPADADTERALATALAGRVAGKPQDCVEQSRLQGPEEIGARDLLYRQSGKRVWRNTLPQSCGAAHGDDVMVVETFGAQLCRGDRFQRVNRNSGLPSSFCHLGAFTPYDKVNR